MAKKIQYTIWFV